MKAITLLLTMGSMISSPQATELSGVGKNQSISFEGVFPLPRQTRVYVDLCMEIWGLTA
ncbi:hypothetical protein IMZ48_44965 [Candidatus Bathyarchaeota archaeon]|nr:hypothetical protein [Candidatus Bathyarchaeota archaeon]